jgi:hypothetical protein
MVSKSAILGSPLAPSWIQNGGENRPSGAQKPQISSLPFNLFLNREIIEFAMPLWPPFGTLFARLA